MYNFRVEIATWTKLGMNSTDVLQFQRQNCLFTQNLKQMYGRSRKYKTEKQNTKKGKFSFLSWDPFIHVCCKTTISNIFFFFFFHKGTGKQLLDDPNFFIKLYIAHTPSQLVGEKYHVNNSINYLETIDHQEKQRQNLQWIYIIDCVFGLTPSLAEFWEKLHFRASIESPCHRDSWLCQTHMPNSPLIQTYSNVNI